MVFIDIKRRTARNIIRVTACAQPLYSPSDTVHRTSKGHRARTNTSLEPYSGGHQPDNFLQIYPGPPGNDSFQGYGAQGDLNPVPVWAPINSITGTLENVDLASRGDEGEDQDDPEEYGYRTQAGYITQPADAPNWVEGNLGDARSRHSSPYTQVPRGHNTGSVYSSTSQRAPSVVSGHRGSPQASAGPQGVQERGHRSGQHRHRVRPSLNGLNVPSRERRGRSTHRQDREARTSDWVSTVGSRSSDRSYAGSEVSRSSRASSTSSRSSAGSVTSVDSEGWPRPGSRLGTYNVRGPFEAVSRSHLRPGYFHRQPNY